MAKKTNDEFFSEVPAASNPVDLGLTEEQVVAAEELLIEEDLHVVQVIDPPGVPEAQMVFDAGMGERFLRDAYLRTPRVADSVRFDPEGMPEEKIGFLLDLAARLVKVCYIARKPRREERGVFWVPSRLADHPVLSDYEVGRKFGDHVAFHPVA